jgi:surface antigen
LPDQYRQNQNVVADWRSHNLSAPPRGYRWMCYQGGNCFLVSVRTDVIRDTRWRDDRDAYWRQSYTRTYSYNDDIYYRECRSRPDPVGVLLGGLIGGLLGHAADNNNAGATVAGIIIGGVAGAALTNDMDCGDRNYSYRAYYDALNGGRAGVVHRWRNPSNNHHGDFLVRSYYSDAHGFQCANYRHTAYLDRQRQANGRACRQPDGAWVFLN